MSRLSTTSESLQETRALFRARLELDEDFGHAPTGFQREWLTSRALREFGDDLDHLSKQLARMVPGVERPAIEDAWNQSGAAIDDAELIIQGQQVMQAWEDPLMKAIAGTLTETAEDILEVGFGMGISATYLLEAGIKSYSVIEANVQIEEAFANWASRYPETPTRLIPGMWQDVEDQLESYDGIFFDTYPLSQEEYLRNEVAGTAYTHCAEFFPLASRLLRPGGVFTYFSCEIDSLSRGHQRLLQEHFDGIRTQVVRGLTPPSGCQYWWSDSMVVVSATKN